MGLGKSKQPKPAQPGVGQNMMGNNMMAMPQQPGFSIQPQQQQVQACAQQIPVQPSYTFATPSNGTAISGQQQGYLTFAPAPQAQNMPQQQTTSFYPSNQCYATTLASASQLLPIQASCLYPGSIYSSQTSAYPVSYTSQQYRPLIPGYAPAPTNDRRQSLMNHQQSQQQQPQSQQSQQQSQEQDTRYVYGDQQQQQQHSNKQRKHWEIIDIN
jgi:hypothetical protein